MDEEVIPILRVADAAASVAWYGRPGFTQEWVHRFEPGMPAFVSVARDRVRDPDGNRLRVGTPTG